jgi:hypothetical protein
LLMHSVSTLYGDSVNPVVHIPSLKPSGEFRRDVF